MSNICNNCSNTDINCSDNYSSNCIIWDGTDIECLGISKGDNLTFIENAIAEKVCLILDSINLTNVSLCGDILTLIENKDKNVANLLQALITESCTLRELIANIENTPAQIGVNVDIKCLSINIDPCDIDKSLDLNIVLQTIINGYCALKTQVDNIEIQIGESVTNVINETIIDGVLSNKLLSCQPNRIVKSGAASTAVLNYRGFVPPFVALPYFGSLSYFDGTGKGIIGTPMCNYNICNGNNGTPDLRGFTIVGAINGAGGGTLSPLVDPTLPQNAGMNYSIGDSGGENRHKLTISEIPSHGHGFVAAPHTHTVALKYQTSSGSQTQTLMTDAVDGIPGSPFVKTTSSTIITGTISNTGSDQYHENRMPFKAAIWIMMVD